MSQQYDEVVIKIENLESDRKLDWCHIKQLEEMVENLERMLYTIRIEMKNIPKKSGESKEDLYRIVADTGNVLELSVQRQEIKDIFCTGKKDVMSSIVVDFVSITTKDNIIKKSRLFNNNNKLNTTHLKMNGPKKAIYVSQKLTTKNQCLYSHLPRKFAKDNNYKKNYKFCCVSSKKVFLRRNDGKNLILVNNKEGISDLHQEK